MPPEMIIQAETRFSESLFVQECLEWHNNYRSKHLAPALTLDPPVSFSLLLFAFDRGHGDLIFVCNTKVHFHFDIKRFRLKKAIALFMWFCESH